uniref:Calmodulin binding protein-like N-terminal domain-containing protein n=1 Tax=Oryza brachyantha TaxID=4533 RepID=J3ML40_ORYBR
MPCTEFIMNQAMFPVQLVRDMPHREPTKRWNLLDQLMPLYSCQPTLNNCGLASMRLMRDHFGSLTIVPKEVMQTRRKRGVLIEPLEPDVSDEVRPLKRKLHCKYRLKFVNKVCEEYYTCNQIKADDGNLLKVALLDESDTKITRGPLSSASVEIVVLHGDFDGEDYWSLEEFSRCMVSPPPGEEASSVLGGDRILFLADGEAGLTHAFFQITSLCARTGKFKMGAMLASAEEERIQEGISESFRVRDHRVKFKASVASRIPVPPIRR